MMSARWVGDGMGRSRKWMGRKRRIGESFRKFACRKQYQSDELVLSPIRSIDDVLNNPIFRSFARCLAENDPLLSHNSVGT